MKYLKIDKYIISLDYIHGVVKESLMNHIEQRQIYQVIITYTGGVSVMLDFKTLEECEDGFNKIAEVLGAI